MKYKDKELVEFKTTENVIFDPPKKMLVWDNDEWSVEADVVAVLPSRERPVVAVKSAWKHCAEIPEEASKLATHRQLAKWLAEDNGQMKLKAGNIALSHCDYVLEEEQALASDCLVRKWDDSDWHTPSLEYMGIGEGTCGRSTASACGGACNGTACTCATAPAMPASARIGGTGLQAPPDWEHQIGRLRIGGMRIGRLRIAGATKKGEPIWIPLLLYTTPSGLSLRCELPTP